MGGSSSLDGSSSSPDGVEAGHDFRLAETQPGGRAIYKVIRPEALVRRFRTRMGQEILQHAGDLLDIGRGR